MSQPVSLRPADRAAVLRHVADRGVAARRRLAEHADLARGDGNEPERGAHQRGLAGAVGAQHADEFAVLDGEARRREDVPAAELDRDVVEAERAHCVWPASALSRASNCPIIHA